MSRALALSLALTPALACAPDTGAVPGGDSAVTDSGGGSAAPEGCSGADPSIFNLRVAPTAVASVLSVRFDSEVAGAGAVDFRLPDGSWAQTARGPVGLSHERLVVGLPFSTDTEIVARLQVAEEAERCSAALAASTTGLGAEVPGIHRVWTDESVLETGYLLAPLIQQSGSHLLVFDRDGELVWAWQPMTPAGDRADPSPVYRMRRSPDGDGLLYLRAGDLSHLPGQVVHVSWDGQLRSRVEIPTSHTDFVLLPGGGMAVLGWEVRSFGERRLLGDTIIEVGVDGSQTVVWRSFDDLPVDLGRSYPQGFVPDDPTIEDWSHVNGLFYDADRGEYVVSVALTESILGIDRASGQRVWSADKASDSPTHAVSGAPIAMPHSSERVGDRLLVFNRGSFTDLGQCSSAVAYELDEGGTATESWSFTSEVCQRVAFLGNATTLPGGDTLASWSSAGRIDVVNPEGDGGLTLSLGVGAAFGFVDWAPRLAEGVAP